MAVNPLEDVSQVQAVSDVRNAVDSQQPSATQQENRPSVPVDQVTLSPEASALVAEQQVLKNANNGLSPAAEQIQTQQRLAAAAAAAGKSRSGQTTAGSLWKSALALTSD
jgi:hypothetical protein